MRQKMTVLVALIVGMVVAIVILHVHFIRSLSQAHDFGAILGQAKLTHTFVVPNFSVHPLSVVNVTASCGCTVVKELEKHTPPFGKLEVPVEIDISQKVGPTSSEVLVSFADGSHGKFIIAANVFPPLPAEVDLGRFKRGETIRRAYILADDDVRKFCPPTPRPGIELAFEVQDGHPIVELVVTPELEAWKDFSTALVFNCPDEHTTTLRVHGYVEDKIEAPASIVSVGYLRADEKSTAPQTIRFRSPYGDSFRWRDDITQHSEAIELASTALNAGEVQVKVKGPLTNGLFSETIDFQFELANAELVTVPVTIHACATNEKLYATNESNGSSVVTPE